MERIKKRLFPLANWDKNPPIPGLRRATLYKARTLKRWPNLFVKFCGRVFVDLDVLEKYIADGRGQ